MAETQVVKVQHGCGCLSGCGTAIALAVVLGPTGLLTWATEHSTLTIVMVLVGAVGVGVLQAQTKK
jgi:hypothetical protein